MAKERRPIDINKIHGTTALLHILEELRVTNASGVIQRDGQDVAIISPIKAPKSAIRSPRETGIVTREDSLWNIVGMASSEGPGNVARNKDKYLAEAYATKRA